MKNVQFCVIVLFCFFALSNCISEVQETHISVTGITLNSATLSLTEGSSELLTATVLPEDAGNRAVVWSSSNSSVATVDKGVVTAITQGSATITVRTVEGDKTATCLVTVTPLTVSVTDVTLNVSTLSLAIGGSATLVATIQPSLATNKEVTWSSSNSNVATVNSNGVVTAIATGYATIVVITQDGSKTASCYVTVTTESAVTGITLNKSSTTLSLNGMEQLIPVIYPSYAANQAVTWSSSNSSIVTVNGNGIITGVAAGDAIITVRTDDGGKTATCYVTVTTTAVAVTGVTLNKSSTTLVVNGTEQLSPSISPANATNQSVTWSSSNNNVATVNSYGLVTAIAAGSATISVRTVDGGRIATCDVTVATIAIAVTGVSLNRSSTSLMIGGTEQLTPTLLPANATNQSVTWSSSNSNVAMVTSYGLVTALAVGNATITVKTMDGEKIATCSVTVIPITIPVSGVLLNKNTLNLIVGGSETLTASIQPANATNQAVTWNSSNTNVAVVSSDGLVTAITSGTTTITVRTVDGNHTASCIVSVTLFYGGGTAANPFIIGSAAELAKLAELVNHPTTHTAWASQYYKLNTNLYLSDYGTNFNGGKGWIPIGNSVFPFSGIFDGGNHTISGLYINDQSLNDAGLFGNMSDGIIRNLGVQISTNSSTGIRANNYVGGVVGSVNGRGSVMNCNTTGGAVSGRGSIGGVAGAVRGVAAGIVSSLINCYATVPVLGATGSTFSYVGGVAGQVLFGNVTNCYATGRVDGTSNVGGVAGLVNNSSVTNCYAIGPVYGDSDVGGVAGGIQNSGSVTSCYATGIVYGTSLVGGVVGSVSGNGIITGNAALSQYIMRTSGTSTGFGRVVGYTNSGILVNNVAWSGMQAGNVSFSSDRGSNHINGADVTTTQITTLTFWTTTVSTWAGWDTSIWDVAHYRLPILRNTGGNQVSDNPPLHLQ